MKDSDFEPSLNRLIVSRSGVSRPDPHAEKPLELLSRDDELEVLSWNVYDHTGNLLETWQQLNNDPAVMIAQFVYNKYGELVEKNLHSTDGGISFLQSIDFDYTIRGWLDRINNPTLNNDGTDDIAVTGDLFGA